MRWNLYAPASMEGIRFFNLREVVPAVSDISIDAMTLKQIRVIDYTNASYGDFIKFNQQNLSEYGSDEDEVGDYLMASYYMESSPGSRIEQKGSRKLLRR